MPDAFADRQRPDAQPRNRSTASDAVTDTGTMCFPASTSVTSRSVANRQQALISAQTDGLKKTIHLHLERRKDKIKQYEKLLDMADPKNILKRGFSITRSLDGNVLYSKLEAKKAKKLQTTFADGVIESEVQ